MRPKSWAIGVLGLLLAGCGAPAAGHVFSPPSTAASAPSADASTTTTTLVAPTATTTVPSGGPTTVPGDPMTGTALTAYGPNTGQVVAAIATDVAPDPEGITFTFEVENRGTQAFHSYPNEQLVVTDYSGQTFTPLDTTVYPSYGGPQTILGAGALPDAIVTVSMPTGDAPRTIRYTPFGWSQGAVTWTVGE